MLISRSQFLRAGLLSLPALWPRAAVAAPRSAASRPGPAPAAAGRPDGGAAAGGASAGGASAGGASAGGAGSGAARLVAYPVDLHLRHAWTLSRNTSTVKRNYIVELHCDGLVGRGEAAPNVRFHESPDSVAAALSRAAQIVATVHPRHRVELVRRLRAALPEDRAARCAVDLALWDWNAQALGVPVYRLLGLDPTALPESSFSISIAGGDELRDKLREAAAFPLLKLKLGADRKGGPTDAEILQTVRAAAPDKRLRVDPNEGWQPAEARDKLRWLAGLRLADGASAIELCEQPLPAADLPALRALYQAHAQSERRLPLLLDESVVSAGDLPALAGACDGVVLKLQKAGGISFVLDEIAVARALGLRVMLGCMIETSVGITAAAHLGPLCDYLDLDGNLLVRDDPFRGAAMTAGRLRLTDQPGLGVTPAG